MPALKGFGLRGRLSLRVSGFRSAPDCLNLQTAHNRKTARFDSTVQGFGLSMVPYLKAKPSTYSAVRSPQLSHGYIVSEKLYSAKNAFADIGEPGDESLSISCRTYPSKRSSKQEHAKTHHYITAPTPAAAATTLLKFPLLLQLPDVIAGLHGSGFNVWSLNPINPKP